MSHGLFAQVAVWRPRGAVQQVVLLLSGEAGPGEAERQRAEALTAQGALVAVVDTAAFMSRLDAEGATCSYPAGAFENLSRYLQAVFKLTGAVRMPLLVGQGAGGALAYAMLAQAAPGTFGGALSIGFCPHLPFRQPVCGGRALPPSQPASVPSVFDPALRPPAGGATSGASSSNPAPGTRLAAAAQVPAPWLVLQPAAAPACARAGAEADGKAFAARVRGAQWRAVPVGEGALGAALQQEVAELAALNRPAPGAPPSLSDLPVVEVPTTSPGQRYAVMVSGDGGWAAIDKDIAAALAKRGIPVVGFDSLRYFWSARTPQGLAADLDRVARFYAARWGRSELILIGFSQGADVLPFAINRMDAESRARLLYTVLLSPGQKASFEFKLSNWLGPSGDVPVLPEAQRLDRDATLCVSGSDDKESICPALAAQNGKVLTRKGGHHFDGQYDTLVQLILGFVP